MTWTDPTTRSTGDLITAAVWNTDVVDNLIYLNERLVTLLVAGSAENARGYLGDWGGGQLNAASGQATSYSFALPADCDALVTAKLLIGVSTGGTFGYDLTSDYGAEGEHYANHSSALTAQTVSLPANSLALIDVMGVLPSAAAGDFCAVKCSTTGANNVVGRYLGLLIQYLRA